MHNETNINCEMLNKVSQTFMLVSLLEITYIKITEFHKVYIFIVFCEKSDSRKPSSTAHRTNTLPQRQQSKQG